MSKIYIVNAIKCQRLSYNAVLSNIFCRISAMSWFFYLCSSSLRHSRRSSAQVTKILSIIWQIWTLPKTVSAALVAIQIWVEFKTSANLDSGHDDATSLTSKPIERRVTKWWRFIFLVQFCFKLKINWKQWGKQTMDSKIHLRGKIADFTCAIKLKKENLVDLT